MPRKKKTKRQLAQIKRDRQYESLNRMAKKVLDIWEKEYKKNKYGQSESRRD